MIGQSPSEGRQRRRSAGRPSGRFSLPHRRESRPVMVTEAQHRRKETGDALAPSRVEVAVIGAGPAGLTVAIALASAGIETALVSKRPPGPDNRTTALLGGSVQA